MGRGDAPWLWGLHQVFLQRFYQERRRWANSSQQQRERLAGLLPELVLVGWDEPRCIGTTTFAGSGGIRLLLGGKTISSCRAEPQQQQGCPRGSGGMGPAHGSDGHWHRGPVLPPHLVLAPAPDWALTPPAQATRATVPASSIPSSIPAGSRYPSARALPPALCWGIPQPHCPCPPTRRLQQVLGVLRRQQGRGAQGIPPWPAW